MTSSADLTKQVRQITGSISALMQPSLHEPYVEPQRAAKLGVSSEAATYLERNRGQLVIIGGDGQRRDADGSGSCSFRGPRVIGRQGAEILQRSYGTVGQLIQAPKSCDHDASNVLVIPRVKGVDGEDILRRSVNGTMATLMNADDNRSYTSPRPVPRVSTGEAESNATKGRGVMEVVFDASANRNYQSARPCGPRVTLADAETNAINGRGTMMDVMAHTAAVERQRQAAAERNSAGQWSARQPAVELARNRRSVIGMALSGQLPGSPFGDVRIKSNSGRQNYELGTRGAVGNLLGNTDNVEPGGSVPVKRPPSRCNENAEHGRNGTVHRLINSYGEFPVSDRAVPRVKPEARRTALDGSGKTMAEYINPRKKPAKRPTRRKLGLSKNAKPSTTAVAFGRTLDRPPKKTVNESNVNVSRPSTA